MSSSGVRLIRAVTAAVAIAMVPGAMARPPAPVDKPTAQAGVQPNPRVADQLKAAPPAQLPSVRALPAPQMLPAPAAPASGAGADADCKPVTGGEVCGGVFYQGGRGARTGVGVDPVPNVNLRVVAVEWLPPQPLTDQGEFLQAVQTAGKLATVGPRMFLAVTAAVQRGVTTTVGPQQRSSTVQSVVVSPVLRVRLRNDGRERWASDGAVEVLIRPGTARENWTFQQNAVVPVPGLKPHPTVLGTGYANRMGSALGLAQIPGSLGPGEERDVQIAFLHGMTHAADKLARYRYLFDIDKFYTAEIGLAAKDPVNPQNKGYRAQFRLGPDGRALEMRLSQVDVRGGPTVHTEVRR